VKYNDEDVNQFEEMLIFTNLMNIKHIEKDIDKNLMPYMQKGGIGKCAKKLCITFHINVGIYLYGLNLSHISYSYKLCLSHMPYMMYFFVRLVT
jgi:hypothetical protein